MESCTQSSECLSKSRVPCCQLKYRPRSFSSKGAKLILLWNFLVTMSLFNLIDVENATVHQSAPRTRQAVVIVAFPTWFLSTILSGWLADVYLGRYKVVKASIVLIWLSLTVNLTHSELCQFYKLPQVVELIFQFIELIVGITGIAAFYVNGLQFGVDQMPDASSEQITSFIASNVTIQGIGVACGYAINKGVVCKTHQLDLVLRIISLALLSAILCTDYLLGNWLMNMKQTVNPFATVYQVLRYAAKHKTPENRSAFTYCEDKIPSRIDNGKTKYGGPFTTEQVENVKTFLRILVMLSTFSSFTLVTLFLAYEVNILVPLSSASACSAAVHLQYIVALVGVIIYEFIIYPLLKKWIPNIMKRIGICMFINMLLSFLTLTTLIVQQYSSLFISQTELEIVRGFATNIYMFGLYIFITSVYEFMYAQSPENMKGFISACFISLSVVLIYILAYTQWYKSCKTSNCKVVFLSVVTAVSILAFFLYVLAARWYKRRDREDVDNARTFIEDIYSRRVQQDPTDSSSDC